MVAFTQNWGILQTRMDQRRDHIRIYIQILMLQTVRAGKVDEKNGVICIVFMFSLWVMVLKLSKKCIFGNFWLSSARNSSLLKQFTYMLLKVLITLSEYHMVYRCQATDFKILMIKISEKLLTQQKYNKILLL